MITLAASFPATPTSLTPLDIILFILLIISCLIGFWRGMAREILGIGGWIGAIFLTLSLRSAVSPLVKQYLTDSLFTEPITLLIIFSVSFLLFSAITYKISSRIRSSFISPLDRSLGLAFGFLRACFIFCLVFMVYDLWIMKGNAYPIFLENAKSLSYLKRGAQILEEILPKEWIPHAQEWVEKKSQESSSAISNEIQEQGEKYLQQTYQKSLEDLSTPKPRVEEPKAPKKQDKERKKLDQLFEAQ